jgi:hypothetical protein
VTIVWPPSRLGEGAAPLPWAQVVVWSTIRIRSLADELASPSHCLMLNVGLPSASSRSLAHPEKCVIAQGGGRCPPLVRASTVEPSSWSECLEHLSVVVWLRWEQAMPPFGAFGRRGSQIFHLSWKLCRTSQGSP